MTRPTLREALQRLGRDGWLEIRQGKPTRVRDYWREGSLGVLGAIAGHPASLPPDFIPNLLHVRLALAPAYSALAVERQPQATAALLRPGLELDDLPASFASFDWQLHRGLTQLSGNPIYTLILNGFADLYEPLACRYFENEIARRASQRFYAGLHAAALAADPAGAGEITRRAMLESAELWAAGFSLPDQP